jgi:AcrR family transcriptional regulator
VATLRGSRRSSKAVATRGRILDAAATVFREKGYTAARLSDIAALANTQAGSLYYHFDSRETLVREVLLGAQQWTKEFVPGLVDAVGPDATSLDRLRQAFNAHLEAVLQISDYTAATLRIMSQVPPPIQREALAAQRDYGRYWRQLFEDAQASGFLRESLNLGVARMLALGSLNSTAEWFHSGTDGGKLKLPELESHASAVFLEGIATQKGRSRQSDPLRYSMSRPQLPSSDEIFPSPATKAEATTVRILDAAAQVFRTNGYAAARLSDVAALANLQTGSLYYHFESREELVTQLLRKSLYRTQTMVRRALDTLPSSASPLDRLATAIHAHMSSVLGPEDYVAAMLKIIRQVPESVTEAIVGPQRQYMQTWHEMVNKGIESGDVRDDLDPGVVVMLMMGAMNGSIDWYDPDHFVAVDRLIDQSEAVLFDGMLARRIGLEQAAV